MYNFFMCSSLPIFIIIALLFPTSPLIFIHELGEKICISKDVHDEGYLVGTVSSLGPEKFSFDIKNYDKASLFAVRGVQNSAINIKIPKGVLKFCSYDVPGSSNKSHGQIEFNYTITSVQERNKLINDSLQAIKPIHSRAADLQILTNRVLDLISETLQQRDKLVKTNGTSV